MSDEPDRSDPLLAEARAALAGGALPDDLRGRISRSTDPGHARARRLLAVIDGGTPAGLPVQPGDDTPPATPKIGLVAPAPDEAATGGDDGDAGGDHGADQGSDEEDGGPTGAGPAETDHKKPKLVVITQVSLVDKGGAVELVVKAAAPVTIGTATQRDSGTVRFVLPSAGALPGALQARPQLQGVRVVDVRRGEDTVQLAVQLDEGWRAGAPRRAPGGASIRFSKG